MKLARVDFNWLRTIITNIITIAVATGLAMNRRRNRNLTQYEWPEGKDAPFVQIIAPARNEEDNVAPLLSSLLAQHYPRGRWGVLLVDDASTDATKKIASEMDSQRHELSVIAAPPLPNGWTGKANAMYAGYLATPDEVDWLLFVDADTRHSPLMLPSVVHGTLCTSADLLSLVINVQMESFWERVLVPQVGELYTLLVGTMDQVNERGRKGAAANGQCMLVRRQLFGALGASEEVRGDVAEDRALAQALKERGYNVRLEYGRNLASARVYSSLRDMWNGYAKTLFWASGHNTLRALGVIAALSLYALTPPLVIAISLAKRSTSRETILAHGAMQMLPMLAVRLAVCRQMGVPPRYALTYPLGVAVGNAMLLFSMYRVLSGKGVRWKGRTYR
ncbi:MAG TPA: glycosyltransferase [Chloroflexia bacterium]|nr:glycosyltransferase [Chloroflexia bacterium]